MHHNSGHTQEGRTGEVAVRDVDMPSQAMQDLIDGFFKDRAKAGASQTRPTLEERRTAFAPAGRIHPLPDDVLVTEADREVPADAGS
jgi:hypothetical protein